MQKHKARVRTLLLVALLALPGVSLASFDRDLEYGLTNDSEVIALQTRLTSEGVYSGPITGNFYSLTRAAVVSYQRREGIRTTGYVGPLTRARLNAPGLQAAPSPVSVGKSRAEQITDLLASISRLQTQVAAALAARNSGNTSITYQNNTYVPVTPSPAPNQTMPSQAPTQPVTPAENNHSSNPVPPPPPPTYTPPPTPLVPKIEVASTNPTMGAYFANVILAEMRLGNLDEDMQFSTRPASSFVTVEHSYGSAWTPEVYGQYMGEFLPGTKTLKKNTTPSFQLRVMVAPPEPGTFTVTINNWEILGQESGNIRTVTGTPITLTFTVE